jgi:predicted O-methyltransferase YrrM
MGLLAFYSRLFARMLARRPTVRRLLRDVRRANLTYVGMGKLHRLAEMALLVRVSRVPGSYLEAGVALGGSAVILGRLKPHRARLELYDVFETIPPPGPDDGTDAHQRYDEIASGRSKGLGGEKYYGYRGDLVPVVRANLEAWGINLARDDVTIAKGLFSDTLQLRHPVAFAHIDCDWHDSIDVCIDRIFPVLSPGGIMVFDDYRSYSGARSAIDAFLARSKNTEVLFRGRSIAVRKRA